METLSAVKEICPTTTLRWVENGALIVDVRENSEVDQLAFDVPNLLHIPLSDFEERYTEIPQDRNVVMVCQVGIRSLRATGYLVNHGYTNVVNMQKGINKWVQKGFPVKGDTSGISADESCCSS